MLWENESASTRNIPQPSALTLPGWVKVQRLDRGGLATPSAGLQWVRISSASSSTTLSPRASRIISASSSKTCLCAPAHADRQWAGKHSLSPTSTPPSQLTHPFPIISHPVQRWSTVSKVAHFAGRWEHASGRPGPAATAWLPEPGLPTWRFRPTRWGPTRCASARSQPRPVLGVSAYPVFDISRISTTKQMRSTTCPVAACASAVSNPPG